MRQRDVALDQALWWAGGEHHGDVVGDELGVASDEVGCCWAQRGIWFGCAHEEIDAE